MEKDLLAIKNSPEKQTISRLFLYQQGLSNILFDLYGIANIATGNSANIAIGSAVIVLYTILLIKKWYNPFTNDEIIIQNLINSNTYKELMKEYDEYISHIAAYLKKLPLNSSIELLFYLENMMASNFLSTGHNFEYKNFANDYEVLSILSGARVATGKAVCRHYSAFFSDILNKVGYEACVNKGLAFSNNPPTDEDLLASQIYNHALVSVIDNSERFIYCPTSNAFFDDFNDYHYQDTAAYHSIRVVKLVTMSEISESLYYLLDNNQFKFNEKNPGLAEKISNQPFTSLNPYDLKHAYKLMEQLYNDTFPEMIKFRLEEDELIRDIANKSLILSPCSDREITSWKVK